MITFRHCDPRFPFLWEDASQPPARWHGAGEGPVQYLADTPDGAWAEFLRHEEITSAEDLDGIRRALWAVDVPDPPTDEPDIGRETMVGGMESYAECRAAASRARSRGASGLIAPSAAMLPDSARGFVVDGGLKQGPARTARVFALFGKRPDLAGWMVADAGRPPDQIVDYVRHFG